MRRSTVLSNRPQLVFHDPRNPYWRGSLDTVQLSVLISLDQLFLIIDNLWFITSCLCFDIANIIYNFMKQATFMRRSTTLSLPLQLVFPGLSILYSFNCLGFGHRQNRMLRLWFLHLGQGVWYLTGAGNAKANGREPKTCLGWVFNYKFGCFEDVHETYAWTPTHVYHWKLLPGFVLLAMSMAGEKLKVVWAEFSTLSLAVSFQSNATAWHAQSHF